jgi:hypothetical protein
MGEHRTFAKRGKRRVLTATYAVRKTGIQTEVRPRCSRMIVMTMEIGMMWGEKGNWTRAEYKDKRVSRLSKRHVLKRWTRAVGAAIRQDGSLESACRKRSGKLAEFRERSSEAESRSVWLSVVRRNKCSRKMRDANMRMVLDSDGMSLSTG